MCNCEGHYKSRLWRLYDVEKINERKARGNQFLARNHPIAHDTRQEEDNIEAEKQKNSKR